LIEKFSLPENKHQLFLWVDLTFEYIHQSARQHLTEIIAPAHNEGEINIQQNNKTHDDDHARLQYLHLRFRVSLFSK
jgi:hypothetical protein